MSVTVEKLIAEVEAKVGKAVVQLTTIEQKLESLTKHRRGKTVIDVDDKGVVRAKKNQDALNVSLKKTHESMMDLISIKTHGTALFDVLKIPAMLSAAGPAAAGVGALASGAVGLTAALKPLTGMIVAYPGAITAAGLAFGTFKLAMGGASDAAKEYGKAMAEGGAKGAAAMAELDKSLKGKLNPSALQFAKTSALLKQQIVGLSKDISGGMFSGFNDGLALASTYLKSFTPQLRGMADVFGEVARSSASFLGSGSVMADFKGIFTTNIAVVRSFSGAVVPLLDAFRNGMSVVSPFMLTLTSGLVGVAGKLSAWVAFGRETGSLSKKLDDAFQTGMKLWGIFKDITVALNNTVNAARPLGDWMLDNIASITNKWEMWTRSVKNQNAMRDYFNEAKPLLEEASLLVRDLATALFKVQTPDTMLTVIRTLREDMLPALVGVVNVAGKSGLIESFARALTGVTKILASVAGSSGVLLSTTRLFADMLTMIGDMIERFPQLGGVLSNLSTSFGLLKVLGVSGPIGTAFAFFLTTVQTLTGSVDSLIPIIAALGGVFATLKIATFVNDLRGMVTAIQGGQSVLSTLSKGLSGASGAAAGASGGAKGLAGALAGAGGLSVASLGAGAAVGALAAGVAIWSQKAAEAKQRAEGFSDALSSIHEPKEAKKAVMGQMFEAIDEQKLGDDLKNADVKYDKFVKEIISKNITLDKKGRLTAKSTADILDGSASGIEKYDKKTQDLIKHIAKANETWNSSGESRLGDTIDAINEVTKAANKGFDDFADKQIAMGNLTEGQVKKIKEQNSTYRDGEVVFFDYTKASEDVTKALTGQSIAMNEAAEKAQGLTKQLQQQQSFLQMYIAGRRSQAEAEDKAVASHDNLMTTVKENGNVWTNETEKGRSNRDMLRQLFDAYSEQADAVLKAGGSAEEANAKYGGFLTSLQEMVDKGLISKDAVAGLTDQLGLTAKDWKATIDLKILNDAQQKLQLIKDSMEFIGDPKGHLIALNAALKGDWATVDKQYAIARWIAEHPDIAQKFTLTTIQKSIDAGVGLSESSIRQGKIPGVGYDKTSLGKDKKKNAQGSVLNFFPEYGRFADGTGAGRETHVAEIAPAGAMRVWAEPETGGEAYIPLHPQKRKRSIAIWQETGRRLGVAADQSYDWFGEDIGTTRRFAMGGFNPKMAPPKLQPQVQQPPYIAPPPPTGKDYTEELYGPIPKDQTVIKYVQAAAMNALDAVSSAVASAFTGKGGNASLLSGWKGRPGSYRALMSYGASTGVPMRASSTIRPGARTRASGRASLHSMSRAVDWTAPGGGVDTPGLLAIERAFLPVRAMLTELIYSGPGSQSVPRNPITRADHHNHVHTGLAKGGIVKAPTSALIGEAGYPEAVLPLKNGAVVTYQANGGVVNMKNGGTVDADYLRRVQFLQQVQFKQIADTVQGFRASPLADIFNSLEKIMSAAGNWSDFLKLIAGQPALKQIDIVQKKWQDVQRWFASAAEAAMPPQYANIATSAWSRNDYLLNTGKRKLTLGAGGEYDSNIEVRKFGNAVVNTIQQMGGKIKQTDFGQWDVDTSAITDIAKLGQILDGLSSGGWNVNAQQQQDTNKSPYVVISNAVFKEEADMNMLMSKLEWAVRTENLPSPS